jgi:hypothetical protein
MQRAEAVNNKKCKSLQCLCLKTGAKSWGPVIHTKITKPNQEEILSPNNN